MTRPQLNEAWSSLGRTSNVVWSAAFQHEQDTVVLATVDAACLTNLCTVVCKMPVHPNQQLPDRYLVPLALLAGELQQNRAIPVVGNMREKVYDMPARSFDQGQGWLNRSFLVGQCFCPVSLVVGVAEKGTARPSKGRLKDHQEHGVGFSKVVDNLANRPLVWGAGEVEVGFSYPC